MRFILVFFTLLFTVLGAQGQTCQGSCNLTGVVNDFWSGLSKAEAGASSITVGARRSGGAGNPIAIGDLLLVIQMQDAVIDTSDSTAYGANNATGSGYTDARQSGRYEYVYAASARDASAGSVSLSSALINSYSASRFPFSQGTPSYQVIRVPNCVTATLTGAVTSVPWGSVGGLATGGVVAIRAINLNMNGQTIDVNAMGFRGGATDAANGILIYPVTLTFRDDEQRNQFKGEGIAGAPRALFNRATDTEINTLGMGGSGLPSGNRGRGAPGNAGGGGNNDAGGGGGGNGGGGGVGGLWDRDQPDNTGGRGGAAFTERAFDRVVLGGGGGGGSAGSPGGENTVPYGVGANPFSRGGAGGGIVLVQATNRSGSLTINADGQAAPFTDNATNTLLISNSGGGGAGGSIVLFGAGGTIAANVRGGNGATSQRLRHLAQGGGGGGGVVFATSATGVTANTGAGQAGCQVSGLNDFGAGGVCNSGARSSTQGVAGPAVQTFVGSPPGNPLCASNLSLVKDNFTSSTAAEATTIYTITVRNQGPSAADGTLLRDPVAAGLNCTAVTCSSSDPAGNCPASGVNITNLQGSGITLTSLPASSTLQFSVTCRVTATGQ